jgi:hypothetical protein
MMAVQTTQTAEQIDAAKFMLWVIATMVSGGAALFSVFAMPH